MGVSSVPVSSDPVNQTTRKAKVDSLDSTGSSSNELQDSFLKLLIANVKNQLPTNPMDNSQLTSQLAQIRSLEGIEKLNTTLKSVSGKIDNSLSMNASKMLGHGVMVPGDKILVSTNKLEENSNDQDTVVTPFGFELPRYADSVSVLIQDANGKIVKEIDLGEVKAGVNSYSWDGELSDGTKAADGRYSFTVKALYNEQQVPAISLSYGVVYGIINNKLNNNVSLDLGTLGTANIDEVRQII